VVIDEMALTEWNIDGDGSVGITDLLGLLGSWGPCPDPPALCPADLDGDRAVGITDLLSLLAAGLRDSGFVERSRTRNMAPTSDGNVPPARPDGFSGALHKVRGGVPGDKP